MPLPAPPSLPRPLRIASRGSALALKQAHLVQSLVQAAGMAAEVIVISTSGDRIQDRFLYEIGGKGLFVKELEQALLDGTADCAVHSLKDLPAVVKKPFTLAAFLKRADPEDVLVLSRSLALALGIADEPLLKKEHLQIMGALRIGTGSLRRQALLTAAAPQLSLLPMRGNVDTRLGKLLANDYDGLILARAALQRLAMEAREDISLAVLDPQWFIPCASQGAITVETLESFPHRSWLNMVLDHQPTSQCVAIERAVLAALGGDCTLPIGVHASLLAQRPPMVQVRAVMANLKGQEVRQELTAPLLSPEAGNELAKTLATQLLAAGGREILASLAAGGKAP